MVNKKKLVEVIIFLIILLVEVVFISSSSHYQNKIDEEIYKSLNKSYPNAKVRVIVKIKQPEEKKGVFIKIKKTNEEIKKEKKEIHKQVIEDINDTIDKKAIKHIFSENIAIEVSDNELKKLNKNPNIQSIKIDKPIRAFLQDSVSLINASNVWRINITGINITGTDETICILDTGINFTHPDLIGKNKTCIIDCVGKTCTENCSINDDNGHGTHVAGIAGALGVINGVAVNASLIGVKVLNSAGSGTSSDLNAGLNWCISNSNNYNISVISLSLGTDCSNYPQYCYSSYCDASETDTASIINNATGKNISVIVASGNNGNTTHISSPACIENSTAIASSDKNNNIAGYSNRNSLIDLIAPGSNINSTFAGGSCLTECSCFGNYMICSGTSMAAPHVSGVFALFNQFFKLQNNRTPTPFEIESELNSTGKLISDAGSGLNFSRIDIYSALISIDSLNPNVNLISPENAMSQFIQNASFNCSANDVQLSNLTLYVWNSSGIYNTTTINTSSINIIQEFNLTNVSFDNYKWNCLAYDHNNNFSFASTNYTLTIGRLAVNLNSPENNRFTNKNLSFNCSAETEPIKRLTNLSFFVWNSTNNLIYNLTSNISGIANSSLFNYNFNTEADYKWNCRAYNNYSENIYSNSNYTITYDITFPNITLINPVDSVSYTSNSQSINFGYNISDNNDFANCSLIINNAISLTNSSVNKSFIQNFTKSFSPNNYNWSINCTDNAGNTAGSNSRNFTVNAPVFMSSSGGGGGGGGNSLAKTIILNLEQNSKKYTEKLSKNDKIKFTFFDEKSKEHELILTDIKKDFITLIIKSNLIILNLGIGQSAKLNLTSADYYDLYVKLNSIEDNKAELVIQTIHESISKSLLPKNIIKKTEKKEKTEENIASLGFEIIKLKIIVYGLILIIIFIIIFVLFKERKLIKEILKQKHIENYKKKFEKDIKPKKSVQSI